MRTLYLLTMLVVGIYDGCAQNFNRRQVLPLPEKFSAAQLLWISTDSDTLNDLVWAGVSVDGQYKITTIQGGLVGPWTIKSVASTGMKSGFLQLADWDHDNRADLIVSGKTAINTDAIFPFLNTGNSTFQKQPNKIFEHAGTFRIVDISNDGIPDLITTGTVNGQAFVRVFENTSGTFIQKFELPNTNATDIQVFDLNVDGWNDLIVSGKGSDSKPFISVYSGAIHFKFKQKSIAKPIDGAISVADMNADGYFDLVVAGMSESNQPTIGRWLNQKDSFLIAPTSAVTRTPLVLFTGDLTSDGLSDESLSGRRVNFIREPSNTITPLDTTGLQVQAFGDQDRDGDLDVVQVIDSLNTHWLKFYENTTPLKNLRPSAAKDAFAISTGDKTFIFWNRGKDDHTDSLSLTYDVFLKKDQTSIVSASFNEGNGRRVSVTHGNAGTNRAMMVRNLTDGRYAYFIQTVDNAYNGSYSLCTGGILPCFDLEHNNLEACAGTSIKLPSGGGVATWFSSTRGLLGKSDTLKFVANASDTIYAFVPQQTDCSKNRIFALHVNPQPPVDKEIIYACRQKVLTLSIPVGWKNPTWSTSPPTTGLSSIQITVNNSQVISVQATGLGCTYKKDFDIRISEPLVALEGEGFQILKGTSVQLKASGTATSWQWSPATGLNNATIASPTATPSQTTEYVVTGVDSVGCSATARTTIIVQETAFVPNLFTPNGDGKNDQLLIYGLTAAQKFVFRIFNREGSLVYESKDVYQATTVGWSGYVQGTLQPGGLYYWKIEGVGSSGEKLLLNGKTSGSILLLH